MRKILICVALLATMSAKAQYESYKVDGNVYTAVITPNGRDVRHNADSTSYTWIDSKGVVRPIWVARTGSCFVIRRSEKNGNEYRQYMRRDVSADICKRLGREYKPTARKEEAK